MENKTILFDGVCELCDSFCLFIMDHSKEKFEFIPLQSEEAEYILKQLQRELTMDTVIFINNSKISRKSDAVLEISKHFTFPWSLLRCFFIIPKKLRDALYDYIAKNRYKWFGMKTECRLPHRK